MSNRMHHYTARGLKRKTRSRAKSNSNFPEASTLSPRDHLPPRAGSLTIAQTSIQKNPVSTQKGPSNLIQRETKSGPDADETRARAESALQEAQGKLSVLAAAHDAPGLDPAKRAALREQMATLQSSIANLTTELSEASGSGASGQDVLQALALAGVLLATPIPGDELGGAALVIVQSIRWLLTALRVLGPSLAVTVKLIMAIQALESAVANATGVLAVSQDGGIDDIAKEAPEVWGIDKPSEVFPEVAETIDQMLKWKEFDKNNNGSDPREPDPDRGDKWMKLLDRIKELLKHLREKGGGSPKYKEQVKWLQKFVTQISGGPFNPRGML